jgi:hypothetical protein
VAAVPEVPSTNLPDSRSPEAGQGARRMAPEERIASLMDGLHSILEEAVESLSLAGLARCISQFVAVLGRQRRLADDADGAEGNG